MDIIPALALKGGMVVPTDDDATGARDTAPGDMMAALCAVQPPRRCYIADLDAIAHRGRQDAVLHALAARAASVEFWVEAGVPATDAAAWLAGHAGCLVLSSAQHDTKALRALQAEPRIILLLDFFTPGQAPAGMLPAGMLTAGMLAGTPAATEKILTDETLWPERLIVRSAPRTGAGPDVAQVARVRARGGARAIYAAAGAAWGVRDRADLQALSAAGAAGALVGTALYINATGAARRRMHHQQGQVP